MTQLTNKFGQPVGTLLDNWESPEKPPKICLEGRLCRLEPLDPHLHGETLFETICIDSIESTWTYLFEEKFETYADFELWIKDFCIDDDYFAYAVIDKETGEAIGYLSYLRVVPEHGVIEIGRIHFSKKLKRRTLATEALYLMINQVFDLGYRRCEWKCDALNGYSRYAAERLGFSYEGLFRQAIVYKGRNRDTAWYSIIDSEWEDLRKSFLKWLSPENFDRNGNQITHLHAPMRFPSS